MLRTVNHDTPGVQDHECAETEQVMSRRKACAALLSLLVIGIVLVPIAENWKASPKDSFPLSYYPMFSRRRPDVVQITHVVGIDPLGNEYPIPYRYVAPGGMNQVRKQLRKAVRQGVATRLCDKAAGRVARKRKGPLADVDTLAIVTGTYRLDDYIAGKREPESLEVMTICKVVRSR